MGASHSAGHPRSVNLDNQTPNGVMDISDEVVHRLKNSLAEENKKAKAQPPPPPPPSSSPQADQPRTIHQPTLHYNEPSISALEVRRQKDLELQQNDLYWRKRMSQLEQTLNKTNSIMEKEYSLAIDDVRRKFTNSAAIPQLPACQDMKTQLLACYRANPQESLKCSEEVKLFTNCVNQNRIMKLDAAGEEGAAASGGGAADKTAKKIPPKAA